MKAKTSLIILCGILLQSCGAIIKSTIKPAVKNLNSGDLDSYTKPFSEDVVFYYPGETSHSGVHEGKEAVRSFFEDWKEQFPGLVLTPQKIIVDKKWYLGKKNTVILYWTVAGKNKQDKMVEGSGISMISVEGTKIVEIRDFALKPELLKAHWGEE
ncbi:MAG: nuclear transport factor 2 family protein [Bacteroidota bacterium]